MRPASQHLVPDSFSYWEPCKLTSIFFKVRLFQIITSVIIWTGFKRAAYQFKLGTGQNNLWKEIFISTEKKTHNFWEVVCLKWSRFLPSTLFSFTANWTQTAGFVTVLNPLSSLYEISRRFEFHNLWRAWNRQHWLFIIWHFSLFMLTMELQFREVVSL